MHQHLNLILSLQLMSIFLITWIYLFFLKIQFNVDQFRSFFIGFSTEKTDEMIINLFMHMLKNGQRYFENLAMWKPQGF